MDNKLKIGLGIAGVSLIVALGVALFFVMNRNSIPLSMLILPAFGFLFGIILAVTNVGAQLQLDDEIENLGYLLGDDLEALAQGRITGTHAKVAATLVAIIAEVYLIFMYHKWTASWWGLNVPVVAVAALVMLIIFYGGVTMNWFQNRHTRTYWWVFVMLFVGWAFSIYVGIYYSEPVERPVQAESSDQSYTYNYSNTRASSYWYFDGSSFSTPNIDLSCGDECGALLLFVALLIIVAICILGSAFIPHFWVVATCVLLSTMVLVAVRELLFVDVGDKAKPLEEVPPDNL